VYQARLIDAAAYKNETSRLHSRAAMGTDAAINSAQEFSMTPLPPDTEEDDASSHERVFTCLNCGAPHREMVGRDAERISG